MKTLHKTNNLCPHQLKYRLFLCVVIIAALSFCATAFAFNYDEKERPLSQTDPRAVQGNQRYDEQIAAALAALNAEAEAYQSKQKPVAIWTAFDENQADWEQYFHDETRAYAFADFWTRENAKAEYDNLYKKNRLFSIECRQKIIKEVSQGRKVSERTTERLQAEKTAILAAIKEAEYRVAAWTYETKRRRIVRSNASWQRYSDSTMQLFKLLYPNNRKLWAEVELELLQMRLDMATQQMDALWRIKFEAED